MTSRYSFFCSFSLIIIFFLYSVSVFLLSHSLPANSVGQRYMKGDSAIFSLVPVSGVDAGTVALVPVVGEGAGGT